MNHPVPTPSKPFGVLFLCLGNICRSPLGEGVFIHLARERGVLDRFDVDSAGTGDWHVGNRPDPRSIEVATRHGVELPGRARQLSPETDRERFGLVIAMDGQNQRDAVSRGVPSEMVRRLREWDDQADGELDVPDPYYGGDDGFQLVYEMVHRSCGRLLDELIRA